MSDSYKDIEKQEIEDVEKKEKKAKKRIGKFLTGEILTEGNIDFKFIVFLVVLAVVYIIMKYWADNLAKQEIQLKKENAKLRSKQVTLTFQLIKESQQSKVEEMIKKNGMNLKAPEKPPYVIKMEE